MSQIIYQSSNLYIKEKGKYRHVTTAYLFDKMGLSYDRKWRKYVSNEEIQENRGRDVTEWPEKEVTVGPMRLMFNVPEDADKRRVADMGVTDIFSYGTEWMHNQGLDFLNSCLDEEGKPFVHVIYSLKSSIHDPIRAGGTWNRQSVEGLIARFQNHLVVRGWYPFDEPDQGNPVIPFQTQREIVRFIRDRTDKPITLALRGGTVGWHLVDLDLFDWINSNTYPYNGTDQIWGMKPLDAIKLVGAQEREYLKDFPGLKVMFVVQCCDEPAVHHDPPVYDSKVPLGHVKDIFDTMKPYDVFTKGIGFWGHNHGYFGPESSEEMYDEVKELIGEVK